jgi:hypothetical protein
MAFAEDDDRGEAVYEIQVMGSLDTDWSASFDGLSIGVGSAARPPALTTLTGSVDQAALRGILAKLWDLNLILVSVRRLDQ